MDDVLSKLMGLTFDDIELPASVPTPSDRLGSILKLKALPMNVRYVGAFCTSKKVMKDEVTATKNMGFVSENVLNVPR